jgi:hypothetical protein
VSLSESLAEMQLLSLFSVAIAIAPSAMAKEMAKNEKLGAELYDSGVMMSRIMATKQVSLNFGSGNVYYSLDILLTMSSIGTLGPRRGSGPLQRGTVSRH